MPRNAVSRIAVRSVGVLRHPWTLQKCFKNQQFFDFSPFRPHQARTCMHDTCITHGIRCRYAQSDPKVPPKWPQPPPRRSGPDTCSFSWRTLAPLDPFKNALKANSVFNFSRFRPHQARTCMPDTCITHEIRRRYAQSNLKVATTNHEL